MDIFTGWLIGMVACLTFLLFRSWRREGKSADLIHTLTKDFNCRYPVTPDMAFEPTGDEAFKGQNMPTLDYVEKSDQIAYFYIGATTEDDQDMHIVGLPGQTREQAEQTGFICSVPHDSADKLLTIDRMLAEMFADTAVRTIMYGHIKFGVKDPKKKAV